ncbi:MAG: purine-nucleoside phosphorylase [Erysipelotrichaceae bacterium]
MFYDEVQESVNYLKQYGVQIPEVGVILGSGLGNLIDILEDKVVIAYQDIPHFPQSRVEGHEGNLVFGRLNDQYVMMLQGRFHYYQGLSMKQVTYPVYMMKLFGVKKLIITNACGGINQSFAPGDLMIMDDFINGVSSNPLIGDNDERFGPRFPDMSQPFDLDFKQHAIDVAKRHQIPYQHGVYAFFQGPYYESAAEIKMYASFGCDAIGMSSVPEIIVGNYLGLKVLGIACITNMATGIAKEKHEHREVVNVANQANEIFSKWITAIISKK